MEFYGKNVRTIRKKSKITLEELGVKLSVFRTTISAWENGKRTPSEVKIRLLAKALNTSVDQISNLKPDKPVSSTNFAESVAAITMVQPTNTTESDNALKTIFSRITLINNQLKDSRIIIDALTSSLGSMFYIKDTRLRYILVNHLFLQALSIKDNSLIFNKNDFDIFPGTEAKRNEAEDAKILSTGEAIYNKQDFIPGTRKKRLGLISKIPVLDSEGKIRGVVGSITDITEQKNAEEEIVASHKKNLWLLECLDNVPAFVYIKDKDSKYIYANNRLIEMYNSSQEEVIGSSHDKFFNHQTSENIRAVDLEVIRKGKNIEAEIAVNIPGAEPQIHLEVKHPLKNSDGKVWGLCGVTTDITERKSFEKKLFESENRYRVLAENMLDVIWILEAATNKIKYVSPSINQIFGYSAEEIMRLPGIDATLTPASAEFLRLIIPERIERFKQGKVEFFKDELEQYHKDGHIIDIEVNARYIFNEKDNTIDVIAVSRDITDRKAHEKIRKTYERALESVDAYIWLGRGLRDENGRKTIDKIIYSFNHKSSSSISEKLGSLSILNPEEREQLRALRKPNHRGPLHINLEEITPENPMEIFYSVDLIEGGEINLREKIFYNAQEQLYIGIIRRDTEAEEIAKAIEEHNLIIAENLRNAGVHEDIITSVLTKNKTNLE